MAGDLCHDGGFENGHDGHDVWSHAYDLDPDARKTKARRDAEVGAGTGLAQERFCREWPPW